MQLVQTADGPGLDRWKRCSTVERSRTSLTRRAPESGKAQFRYSRQQRIPCKRSASSVFNRSPNRIRIVAGRCTWILAGGSHSCPSGSVALPNKPRGTSGAGLGWRLRGYAGLCALRSPPCCVAWSTRRDLLFLLSPARRHCCLRCFHFHSRARPPSSCIWKPRVAPPTSWGTATSGSSLRAGPVPTRLCPR